jgi:hypothetical protein
VPREAETEGVVVVDYVPRDPGLTGLASRAALG